MRVKQEQEYMQRNVIEEEKQKLLAQHAGILNQFNPKAASMYGSTNF